MSTIEVALSPKRCWRFFLMPTKVTNGILGQVNNSHDLRKFGAPVFVRIDSLSNDNILVKGTQIDNPNVADDEHSRIIAQMATIAFNTGKQLELDFSLFQNNELF